MNAPIADDRAARMVLSGLSEPGDKTTGTLLRTVGAVATLDLVGSRGALPGVDDTEAELWRRRLAPRIEPDHAERMRERAEHHHLRILIPEDAEWPTALNRLGIHTPIALWIRGSAARLGGVRSERVSIVGARAATSYGEHVATDLAADLVARGRCVVSGGAYGIDGAAHRAAMAAQPGATIAVLAAGLDRPYPAGHQGLFTRISDGGGLLVSELPPGAVATRWRFMQRNRILAALTGATIVVEAGHRSGALDIARRALDLGSPVGAVPGPVTSAASAGCHRLLRDGTAGVVTDVQDVIDLLDHHRSRSLVAARPDVLAPAIRRSAAGPTL